METVITKTPIFGEIQYMVYDPDEATNHNQIKFFGLVDNIEDCLEDNPSLIDEFENRISLLARAIFKFLLESDDSTDDSDSFVFLSEVDKLKSTLEYQLKKELSIEQYKEYLDNLYFLEGELQRRISYINFKNMNEEETENRSR